MGGLPAAFLLQRGPGFGTFFETLDFKSGFPFTHPEIQVLEVKLNSYRISQFCFPRQFPAVLHPQAFMAFNGNEGNRNAESQNSCESPLAVFAVRCSTFTTQAQPEAAAISGLRVPFWTDPVLARAEPTWFEGCDKRREESSFASLQPAA